MLNANDLRLNRAHRTELERAASKHRASRQAQAPKRQPRKSWARLTSLFL